MKERKITMKQTFELLGFYQILEQLAEYANTMQAKEKIRNLTPYLSETELQKHLKETTQAKALLEQIGTPPIPMMEHIESYLESVEKGELLSAEQIEEVSIFLVAVRRLKSYLEKGKEKQISLAFYSDNLFVHSELLAEIERSIRYGKIDDYATKTLLNIRKNLKMQEEKIQEKMEHVLRSHKSYLADSYVVKRNGRMCIPIKKQYKNKIDGTEVDQSSSGATVFIEPYIVAKYSNIYDILKIEEEEEERKILYTLVDRIAEKLEEIKENLRVIIRLDFVFAKGKMSIDMRAIEPCIQLERNIKLSGARHPLLKKEECVPLDFEIGNGKKGVIITGPNTGGKTVAIKTVGLFSVMACAGLHVPADKAEIAMNSQVLCDIGDGQNIKDNLSTFSAHINRIMELLRKVNEESLVILDELGSGTDPAEGMGIAIAILEQLQKSKALFLVTTHYPEVKLYAEEQKDIINARMAFDKDTLKPLYQLELGKSGESCAFYIAKRLGMPNEMLKCAAYAAYGKKAENVVEELKLQEADKGVLKESAPKIQKRIEIQPEIRHGETFTRGDSVIVMPEHKIGIVVKPADKKGEVLVQIQKEKILINHKRLQLKVAASELYPEDYDFDILFDTVENRKARHKMQKGYQGDLTIYREEGY